LNYIEAGVSSNIPNYAMDYENKVNSMSEIETNAQKINEI